MILTKKLIKTLIPYFRVSIALAVVILIGKLGPNLLNIFSEETDRELLLVFFSIALICALSFASSFLARGTKLPSFVIAIFFGIAAQSLLSPIVENQTSLAVLVGVGAMLILFDGGLDTPFSNFRKLFFKITSLSFPGLLITALLLSVSLVYIGKAFGIEIPVIAAVLLGAVLASTDPAAIIPLLNRLKFYNRDTKDIIVSESALTDVTGTLLTIAFLTLITAQHSVESVTDWYASLFTVKTAAILLKQTLFGICFGILGYFLLATLLRVRRYEGERETDADTAYFFFVPVTIFATTLAFGGSGFLAVFVAGLLFTIENSLLRTKRFFKHTIEIFLKPIIFLLLGALVDIESLISYAGIGIAAALVFMFIIRPLSVFIALGPFSFIGQRGLTLKDLLFISFIRETGAIPAVLLVTITTLELVGINGLVPIGMWVILITLIVEPSLTPFAARFLHVADEAGRGSSRRKTDTVHESPPPHIHIPKPRTTG